MARPSASAATNWAQPTPWSELVALAHRSREASNASGAAIALLEDDPGVLVCYARSGAIAPDIGATLSVEGSLIGLCVQTGRQLRCDDTEADSRAYVAALSAIGIHAVVVTPVRQEGKVRGVLAAFADKPRAFS